MRLISLILITALISLSHQNSYFDTLIAQNLIGSHFGTPSINATYDYVVIGGGTAGLAIATRLAANTSNTVAIVEAGSFYELTNGNNSQVPALAAEFLGAAPKLHNPLVDWVQFTEPMAGLDGRDMLYTQGKTLGGNSARNYMFYMRSATGAYQKWADQVGDQSYTFENLEPYFKKSVEFTPPNEYTRLANSTPLYSNSSFSAQGGPLRVTYPNFSTSFATWIKIALKELGLSEVAGFLDGNIIGFSYCPFALDSTTQTRESSETSFLREALSCETNLNVYQLTRAEKILFDDQKKATGVLVNSGGSVYQLKATKEVIVSSGAFRSPQLLMVSGIGPKETLDSLKIPIISALPGVGQNLQDHVSFGIDWQVNLLTHSALSNLTYAAQQASLYITNRTGALTSTGGEFIGFEKLPADLASTLSNTTRASLAANPPDWPDIELLFSDAFAGNNLDFSNTVPPIPTAMYGTGSAGLVAPFSRGNVTINSTNTAENPLVNPNFLGDVRDREVAIAGFKRARQVWGTQAMGEVKIGAEAYPGSNYTSDEEILEAIIPQALTIYHASATCKMGMGNDSMAVVDSHARVFGVQGLRVVDTSAFPFLPPGHPQGSIYMLAEKIADLINQGR